MNGGERRLGGLIPLALSILLAAPAARAEEAAPITTETRAAIEKLTRRVEELEAKLAERPAPPEPAGEPGTVERALLEGLRRVKIGGFASFGFFTGQEDSNFEKAQAKVWDARFFIEATLARDVKVGDVVAIRDAGFVFEWDLIRLGFAPTNRFDNNTHVGEVFVEAQGILDSDWLNLQIGRFQIPLGENYLRFSRGAKDNPFISNTVGGPWFWDEGIKLYGSDPSKTFGYVASVTNGETPLDADVNENVQGTLKLSVKATDWLLVSASGLAQGRVGARNSPAQAALWLGESFPTAFGSQSGVQSFFGIPIGDGPPRLNSVWLGGGDVVIDVQDWFRLWLAAGYTRIDSQGKDTFDRELYYWIVELVLRGAIVSPVIDAFYLGLRANGLGTYRALEGYFTDFRRLSTQGYNTRFQNAFSAVLGWRITPQIVVRAEFTLEEFRVVRASPRDGSRNANYGIVDIAINF